MQIKYTLDKDTIAKIGTAFLISLAAGIGAGFIGFSKEFVEFLMSEGKDSINWFVVGLAFWLPFSSAVVASFYQWRKGVDLPNE